MINLLSVSINHWLGLNVILRLFFSKGSKIAQGRAAKSVFESEDFPVWGNFGGKKHIFHLGQKAPQSLKCHIESHAVLYWRVQLDLSFLLCLWNYFCWKQMSRKGIFLVSRSVLHTLLFSRELWDVSSACLGFSPLDSWWIDTPGIHSIVPKRNELCPWALFLKRLLVLSSEWKRTSSICKSPHGALVRHQKYLLFRFLLEQEKTCPSL